MAAVSDLGKRITSLAEEHYTAQSELERHPLVQERLRGGKADLPDDVLALLERYKEAAKQLRKEKIDVDVSLVGKLRDYALKADALLLEDISCVDADGNVFERYDGLYVDKDIVRNADGSQVNKTPYEWVSYFERERKSLSSVARSCNILVRLYENRGDTEFNKALMLYKDRGDGYGWHAQNTLVDWGSRKIIHYPNDKDFPKHGGSDNINQSKRVERGFNPKNFKDMLLEDALQMPDFEKFIRNFTGLRQPETLIEIGKYFSKPAKVWVSSSSEVRAAWLGCDNNNLLINSNNNLNNYYAARGVSCEPA